MGKKVSVIRLEDYMDHDKAAEFVKILQAEAAKASDGVVSIIDGDRHLCDFTTKVPDWVRKHYQPRRRIDSDWKPSEDQ